MCDSQSKPVKDIEDAIQNVEMKKRKMEVALDKTRGFVKYAREKRMWRDAGKRTKAGPFFVHFSGSLSHTKISSLESCNSRLSL